MQPATADAGRAEAEGDRVKPLDVQADDFGAEPVIGASADRRAGTGEAKKGKQGGRCAASHQRGVKFSAIDEQRADSMDSSK